MLKKTILIVVLAAVAVLLAAALVFAAVWFSRSACRTQISGKDVGKAAKIMLIVVLILIVAFISSISVFACYLPRYMADNDTFVITEKENTEEITVMSFNVRCAAPQDLFKEGWFYRAKLVRQVISEIQPDVIGFQEVNAVHEKYLKSHLVGYSFVMAYRTSDIFKEGMLIAYRNDRFESEKEGFFWLSETPEKMSKDWNTGSYRVAAYAELKDKTTGKTFTLMDTHLDNASKEARAKGMNVILQQKEKLGIGTMILLGDMNDFEDSPMYAQATGSGLVDAKKITADRYDGPGPTWHDYGKCLDEDRIDFFFLSPSVAVDKYVVYDKTYDGVYPSDHFPLYIKITLA